MNTYKAILFDLDGTLLDTVPGLAKSMNEVLTLHHFPTHTLEEYKQYIGNGIKALVDQSVPSGTDNELLKLMYIEKTKRYQTYWKEGTKIFPGVSEMLTNLVEQHITLTIFSNKEDFFTQQIVKDILSPWKFSAVSGRTDAIPKKPNPLGVQTIMNKFSHLPQEWLYVGDKDADIETANNAGIDSVWVSWGYQSAVPSKATYRIDAPHQLVELLRN